jgi:hypothetical protein
MPRPAPEQFTTPYRTESAGLPEHQIWRADMGSGRQSDREAADHVRHDRRAPSRPADGELRLESLRAGWLHALRGWPTPEADTEQGRIAAVLGRLAAGVDFVLTVRIFDDLNMPGGLFQPYRVSWGVPDALILDVVRGELTGFAQECTPLWWMARSDAFDMDDDFVVEDAAAASVAHQGVPKRRAAGSYRIVC